MRGPQAMPPLSQAQRHWQAVNSDGTIQFQPWHAPAPTPPPAWWQAIRRAMASAGDALFHALAAIGRWFAPLGHAINTAWQALLRALNALLHPLLAPLGRMLGVDWHLLAQIVLWLGLALIVAVASWLIWRNFGDALTHWAKRRIGRASPGPAPWVPDAAQARALLDEADALASDGQYDEAVHLLLLRSFEHIAADRPEWLSPATTAREIALLPDHAAHARQAFAIIAARVEASRYALARLGPPDWTQARAAYADFAGVKLKS